MAAGHYVNGVCTDVAVSTDTYYSQIAPSFTSNGDASNYHSFSNASGTWTLDVYSISITGIFALKNQNTLALPSLASCVYEPSLSNTERFIDGNILGWGVAAAMAAAWAVHILRRGL